MPGPNVGSVSVRVTPDLKGFKEQVRAELASIGDIKIPVTFDVDTAALRADVEAAARSAATKVPVTFDVDTAALRAQLATLGNTLVKVDLDITAGSLASLGTLKAELQAVQSASPYRARVEITGLAGVAADLAAVKTAVTGLDGKTITIGLNVTGLAGVAAQLTAIKTAVTDLDGKTITIGLNVTGLAGAAVDLAALKTAVTELDGKTISIHINITGLVAATAQLAVLQALVTALGGLNGSGSLGGLSSGLSGVGGVAITAAGTFLKLAAGGFVLAEAGAAITAAYGAASTAIAAVPAAIGLIGAPLAAVALGMDGIKAAAKTIKPQFDALQKSVSATFQQGLTPVLKTLGNELFPKLAVGLGDTAKAMSGVATSLGDFVTRGAGLPLLSTAIGNINTAITAMSPGLLALTEGFLRLAGNQAALKALTDTVNELGNQINLISKNKSLDAAFAGLGGVLKSVTTAFGDLVNNGITLFATAAPGAQAAIEGIGQLFSKFDFAALGSAVSSALRGIGSALGGISQGTVDALVGSFQRLGDVLGSAGVQAAIQSVADSLPGLIDQISNGVSVMSDVLLKAGESLDLFGALVSGDGTRIEQAVKNLFSDLPPTVEERMRATGESINTGMATAERNAGIGATRVHDAFLRPVSTIPTDTQGTLSTTTASVQAALFPLGDVGGKGAQALVLGFGTGLKTISSATATGLGTVGTDVTTGLDPAQQAAVAGATAISQAFTTALLPLGQAFTTLTPQITAFGAAITALGPGVAAFGTTFTTLNPALLAFGTTMTTLNPQILAFGTTLTTLNPQILAFGTTLTTLNPQILAFGTTLTTLNPQLLALGTSMTTLNPQLLAFGTNLTTLNPQLLALGTSLTTLNPQLLGLNTSLTTLVPQILAFGTNLTTLNTNLVNFGTALTNAGTAATNFGTAVQQAFTNVSTAITTGMTDAVAKVTQGFADMNAAAVKGGADMVTAITTTMQNFAKAVTDGQTAAVTAIKGVITAMKAAIDVNILKPVGLQLMQGLAAGINEGSSIVQAAVKKVVADAKAAADQAANSHSPSKLFRNDVGIWWSKGMALGALDGIPDVEDAMRTTVRAAHAAAQREVDNLPDLSQEFLDGTGLSDLSAQLDAAYSARDFDTSGSPVVLDFHHTTVLEGKVVEESFKRLNAASKEDLLLKLRAG